MPAPNDTNDLPEGVELIRNFGGCLQPSSALVDLLVHARNTYDWPSGTGAHQSQQTILNLEATVAHLLNKLTPSAAHAIVEQVSNWAGNNARSHAVIEDAQHSTKVQMQGAINLLLGASGAPGNGLNALSALPGVSLVIATKIYRFCLPQAGAAVDRHASYFFNSLNIVAPHQQPTKATQFLREWTNRRRTTTRLAIYSPARYTHNRNEFTNSYLPLLSQIAGVLNALPPAPYTCAATGQPQRWRPADIEMAAYYWWACQGSR